MGGVVDAITSIFGGNNSPQPQPIYQHKGYQRKQSQFINKLSLDFTALGDIIVDDIRVNLREEGNINSTVMCYFVDVAENRRIGNIVPQPLIKGAPIADYLISGFAVALGKERKYTLVFENLLDDINTQTAPSQSSASYTTRTVIMGYDKGTMTDLWSIPFVNQSPRTYIPMGGKEGYQASGSAYRSMDTQAFQQPAATASGAVSFSDIVPIGTSLTFSAYYTNTESLYLASGVTGWNAIGVVESGDIVPPARYWRFKIDFTATASNDQTPRLALLQVVYFGNPLVFSTHLERMAVQGYGDTKVPLSVKAVSDISSTSSAVDISTKKVMIGQMKIDLSPEDTVKSLFTRKLRGKHAMITVGYAGIPTTTPIYSGIVRDMAYIGGKYTLSIQDPLVLSDVSIPRQKYPLWDILTSYTAGEVVSYGDKSYLCILTSTGNQPDISPANWQANGTVWVHITYPAGTHLCDIALDILQNQINIPSERIDFASIDAVKANRPLMVITSSLIIQTQQNALSLLSDIAWLLECFWVMREWRFTLIEEPDNNTKAVADIGANDIKETLKYRRGYAELKNECLILTGYSGAGDTSDQYANGVGVVDATSVQDYSMTSIYEFKDKFGIDIATLESIATRFIGKWKDGRRIVRIDAYMSSVYIEAGDIVRLTSDQLPDGDIFELIAIVIDKNIDWLNQTLKLTLLEVK